MNKEVEKYYNAVSQVFDIIVSNRGCGNKITEYSVPRGFIKVADLSKTEGDLLFPEFNRYKEEKYMYLVLDNQIGDDYLSPGICLYVYRKGTPDTVEVILPSIPAVSNNIEMLTTMTALSAGYLPINFNDIKIIRYIGSWEGNLSILLNGVPGKALDLNDLNFNQDNLRIYYFADKFPKNNFIMDFKRDYYMEPSVKQNKFKSVRDFRNGNAQKFDFGEEYDRTMRDIANLKSDFGFIPDYRDEVQDNSSAFSSVFSKMLGTKKGESKIADDIRSNQFNPRYLHLRYLCEGFVVYFESADAFDVYSYFNFKHAAYDASKHSILSDKFREVCGDYGFVAYKYDYIVLIKGIDKHGKKIEIEKLDTTKLEGCVYDLVTGDYYAADIKAEFKDWSHGYYIVNTKAKR